jgi:ubiquinone/menaquinone biosynthesis C-methylase UbiE
MREMDERFLKEEFDRSAEEHGDYEYWRWKSSPAKRSDYSRTYSCIRQHLGGRRFRRVLEIGCGPGTWSRILLKNSGSLDLVDVSKSMLSRAERALGRGKARYIEGDFQSVRLRPGYDLIASFRALEYMEEKEKVMRKIYMLLKPGGRVMIITKNPKRELRKRLPLVGRISKTPKLHSKQIGHRELSALFRKAGFRDIRVHPVIVHPFLLFQTKMHVKISEKIYGRGCEMPMQDKYLRFIESYLIKAVK